MIGNMLRRRGAGGLVLVALACLALHAYPATAADSAPSAVDDPGLREVIFVFDPRTSPPPARDLVTGNALGSSAVAFVGVFGNAESLRLAFTGQLLSDTEAAAVRAVNPLAPELLATEVIVVRYSIGIDVDAQLSRIRASPLVLTAIRNFRMKFFATPADPYFQVNLAGNPNNFPVTPTDNVQGKYQWGMALLRFPQAWDKIKGSAYIADIDTGVYTTHEDLQANLRPGFSSWLRTLPPSSGLFADPNFDESQYAAETGGTYKGHGTHVAGILAATNNNLLGVAGGCSNCSLMELGMVPYADRVGASMLTAIYRGVQVINMSFGVDPSNPPNGLGNYQDPAFCTTGNNGTLPPCNAIATAQTREVVLVAAAGNDTYHVQFPANQAGVLAVGGLQFWNQAPGYQLWAHDDYAAAEGSTSSGPCESTSSFAVNTGSNCGTTQFLVGPAKEIVSTFYPNLAHLQSNDWNYGLDCADEANPTRHDDSGWTAYLTSGTNGGYADCTGTSMAAPHISALAGLMRSANPLLKVADIKRLMQRYASGNDSWTGPELGYGVPTADSAVISVLSGASASNPTLYNPSVLNFLTPLFSFYNGQARNHFYTVVPQMATSAYNGTLVPSAAYRTSSSSYNVNCPSSCNGQPLNPTPPMYVYNPDGSAAGNLPAIIKVVSANPSPDTVETGQFTDPTTGALQSTGMHWPIVGGGANYTATLSLIPAASYLLPYQIVGNLVPGYTLFPGVTTFGQNPRSSTSVYVSHVNPLGSGPDLLPLYRLSWHCGDFPNSICDTGVNHFHVSHVYTTDATEKQSLLSAGYKLDGIEGYVFPTSYSSAPQSGMVKLCRLYDPVADELILFPGTGTNGKNCYPPFPSYVSGSYYSANRFSTNWLGWVYPNYNGGTPPTVSVTSPTNGQQFNVGGSVTLKASASGNVQSVSYYANGVFIGSKTSSPYQKNWTVNAAGTYIIYGVASQISTGLTTTSAPITITVGTAPPTFANNGFETPVVGTGNYQWAPTGASWTFDPSSPTGGSGISGNGSAFTNANPNAPDPVQVAFIQGAHAISQAVNFTATGTYHVQFYAAQRGGNGSLLQLQLLVDGVNVGTQFPGLGSTSYASYSSSSFSITSTGSHTIAFQGVNNDGLDNSMFFDLVTIASP